MEQETNPRIRAIWERFLEYELGHVAYVSELLKQHERRDQAEILSDTLPEPMPFTSNRDCFRETLANEVDLRTAGTRFVPKDQESADSLEYRRHINSEGSPSQAVAAGYQWAPGTELNRAFG